MNTTAPTALETLVASAEALPQTDITTEAELESKFTSLKKAYAANSQLRLRYADAPPRFLQSELELDDAIRALAPVAVSPALFPSLIARGTLHTITALLTHENEDIVYRSIALLHDLAAVDGSEAEGDASRSLYDALLQSGTFAALADVLDAQLLPRLAAPGADDVAVAQDAVAQTFSIFESSLDARPDLAAAIAKSSKIIDTCVKQVQIPQPNATAVELLAVLVQDAAECKTQFVERGGINSLLEALAPFRKRRKLSAPDNEVAGVESRVEREEMVENMCGVLCSAFLGGSGAKSAFLKLEGVELMVSFMKSSRRHRGAATKVLDFACTGHAAAVQRMLECGGVGVIFAVLGAIGEDERLTPGKKRSRGMSEDEVKGMTEHLLGIVFSLFRYANEDDKRRLLLKLREDGAAKVRKVVALYRHFGAAVEDVVGDHGRYLLGAEGKSTKVDGNQENDEMLVERFEAGLLIVQMGAAIIGEVLAYGDEGMRKAVSVLLPQVRLNVELICRTLEEYAGSIEDGEGEDGKAEADSERRRVLGLVEDVRRSSG